MYTCIENELGRFVTLKMLSWEILQPLEWLQPHGLQVYLKGYEMQHVVSEVCHTNWGV